MKWSVSGPERLGQEQWERTIPQFRAANIIKFFRLLGAGFGKHRFSTLGTEDSAGKKSFGFLRRNTRSS